MFLSLFTPVQAAGNTTTSGGGGILNNIAAFFGMDTAAEDEVTGSRTVDPSSVAYWERYAKNNTQNVGRIWTDKTVSDTDVTLPESEAGVTPKVEIGDSHFLVGLSALSSTSNIATVASTPLDIVLVLDTSGSMDNNTGFIYTHEATTDIRNNGTYYILVNEEYKQVSHTRDGRWRYRAGVNYIYVTPKTDENSDGEQFYSRDRITKMAALQKAVNQFIDKTAEQNDTIRDTAQQHRIALVKFASDNSDDIGSDFTRDGYNKSQIVSELQTYTTADKAFLVNKVNELYGEGATRADYGLAQAQRAFDIDTTPRSNAQKVVIFFTDGEPSTSSSWSDSVAGDAVNNAKDLKASGAWIYSIGVVNGADPSDTSSDLNAYMNGVSSNYPEAVYEESRRGEFTDDLTLGRRVEADKNYYFAATDAQQLNDVFDQISKDINKGSGSPTEITEGFDASNSGYITFSDQLGDYMKVDTFKAVVFADEVFELKNTTQEGKVTRYHFEGKAGNSIYPDGNLEDLVIRVTESEVESVGDQVEVQIPAQLIPLRNFKVDQKDENNPTLSIDAAYPIRLYYGVSLKDGVAQMLAEGKGEDEALNTYVKDNTVDGKVRFYSNDYTGGKDNAGNLVGDTVASFEPASGNSFYYFTENTQIFADQNFNTPVKAIDEAATYYYRQTYWAADNGKAVQKTAAVEFKGSSLEAIQGETYKDENGNLYIEAGTPRLTRVNDANDKKEDNKTNTADIVLSPDWDNYNNPKNIEVALGNNGTLDVELPGALAVKKTVTQDAGLTVPADTSFEFTLSLKNAQDADLTGSYKAQIFDAQNNKVGDEKTVKNGDQFNLKNGETLVVYGLSSGDKAKVTESAKEGFTASPSAVQETTIAGNATQTLTFENHYSVTPVTLDAGRIQAKKILEGRQWNAGDTFEFWLVAEGNAPLPSDARVDEDGSRYVAKDAVNADILNFGAIQYTAPGAYTYEIYEKASDTPGITYSQELYIVTVTVEDDGAGHLTIGDDGVAMVKISDFDGHETSAAASVAEITNQFSTEDISVSPRGAKVFTDNSGEKNLGNTDFTFNFKAVDNAPMPEGDKNADGSMTLTHSDTGSINFAAIPFNATRDDGKTYTYEIREDILTGEGVVDNGDGTVTFKGMTYDKAVWTVKIALNVDSSGTLGAAVTYLKDGKPVDNAREIIFKNSYTPEPLTLSGNAFIQGEKTLTGRDSIDGERFDFILSAVNDKAKTVLPDNRTANVSGLTDGMAKGFNFGDITLTKPGTYVFNVVEDSSQKPEDQGMTYDGHTARVTVKIKDDEGKLTLDGAIVYDNGANQATDKAAFVNTYKSAHTYTGAQLTKTLTGRHMAVDEFTFDVIAKGDAPAAGNGTYKNGPAAAGGTNTVNILGGLTFTQADAGKTYVYTVDEQSGNLSGVTYDQSQYEMAIQVIDNNNGTMSTVTTVSQTMDKDGAAITPAKLIGAYNSADAQVAAPFVNDYTAAPVDYNPVSGNAELHKIIENRDWLPEDSFSFTMAAYAFDGTTVEANPDIAKAIPMPKDATATLSSATAKDGDHVSFDFGNITYTKAGVYVYKVSEKREGNADNQFTKDGLSYSDNVATVTVNVTDDGSGQLRAASTVSSRDFRNVYRSSAAYSDISLSKTVTGHALSAEQFSFTVQAGNAESAEKIGINGYEKDKNNSITVANPEGAEAGKAVVFNPFDEALSFTHADLGKEFIYIFKEVIPEDAVNNYKDGYTYDTASYTIKITLTDNNNGTLSAATTVTKHGEAFGEKILPFTNTYTAASEDDTAAAIDATKKLTGRELKDKEFSFEVATRAAEGAQSFQETVVANGVNDAAGKVTFAGLDGQMTYDLDKLDAAVKAGYARVEDKDGKRQWTLNYTAREKTDKLPGGVTAVADKTSFDFTVVVTDEGGKLAATVNAPQGGIIFENTYTAVVPEEEMVKTDASFTKVLEGRKWQTGEGGDSFTFKLEAQNGAPLPKDDAGKDVDEITVSAPTGVTAAGDDKADFSFGAINFTYDMIAADAGKSVDFVYKVTEDVPEQNPKDGITYTDNTATVTVTVSDKGTGRMSVVTEVENNTFTNTYAASLDYAAAGGLEISKILTGRDMADGQFKFEVKPADKASAAKLGLKTEGETLAAPAAKDGQTADFNILAGKKAEAFTQKDAGAIYKYTVKEVTEPQADGYTYDTTEYTVTITTADDGAGHLTVTTAVTGGEADKTYTYTTGQTAEEVAILPFENSYMAEGSLGGDGQTAIQASKTLTGRDMQAEEFSFAVTDIKGNEVATAANAADGSVDFSAITYTTDSLKAAVKDGVAQKDGDIYSFQYTVYEKTDHLPAGVTASRASFNVVVKVTDRGDGTLTTEVVYPEGADALVFENIYATGDPIAFTPTGAKILAADGLNPADITGKFTFTLKDAGGTAVDTARNDRDGNVSFKPMTFSLEMLADVETAADGSRTKDFVYTVEESGEAAGVVNDAETKTFTLTLKDDGAGHLTVTSNPAQGALFSFINTYSVAPASASVSDQIEITKTLTGRDMTEGEFAFELVDNATNTVVAKGANAADGKVIFDALTYTEPGDHSYTVREVKGQAGGVDYDGAVYTVTTKVTDQGDGTLKAVHSVDGEGIVFTNTYKAKATSVQLSAFKMLEGRDLTEGEFTFQLKDAEGQVVAEAKNDAEGQVTFDAVEYTEAGAYTYTVTEVKGEDANIIYDTAEYKVTVTVEDDLEGQLMATVDDGEAEAIFVNKFTEPAPEPTPAPTPEQKEETTGNIGTGIDGGGLFSAALVILTVGALGAIVYVRKRRS